MKGMFGPRKPAARATVPARVFLNLELGDSCQRRIMRNGAAMRAICLVAPASPTIRRPMFRFRYQRIVPASRKNAQTLSVQLDAMNAGKNTKGARLSAF